MTDKIESKDLSGTKVALINNDKVLTILRDDKPGINFPGMWDLPGGGKENNETPMQVALREVEEELNIKLVKSEILWQKSYPSVVSPGKKAVFMVFSISDEQLKSIIFGNEGSEWKMMAFDNFLSRSDVVDRMQARLHDYLVFAHYLR